MALNSFRLGELITQRREKKPENEDLPIRGVSKDGFIPPKQIDADTDIYNVFYKNDFVYNPARMELGSIAYNADLDKGICSSLYEMFFVHRTDICLPEYLALFVSQDEFARYCNFLSSGSAREYCRFANISQIRITLPSIEEQRKIVHDYKVITDRIEILKKINVNLESIIINTYSNQFGNYYLADCDLLPEGYKIGVLGDYADVKSGYAFKSEWWQENGVKVLKIGNISNNSIVIDECDCVSEDKIENAHNFKVTAGDILIAMTGATTGKIGLVPKINETLLVNQRVGKFFLGIEPMLKTPFLFATLLFPPISNKLQPGGTAGSAQDNLSPDDIKKVPIVLPNKQDIESFNKSFEPIIKRITETNSEIMALNKILQSILITVNKEVA